MIAENFKNKLTCLLHLILAQRRIEWTLSQSCCIFQNIHRLLFSKHIKRYLKSHLTNTRLVGTHLKYLSCWFQIWQQQKTEDCWFFFFFLKKKTYHLHLTPAKRGIKWIISWPCCIVLDIHGFLFSKTIRVYLKNPLTNTRLFCTHLKHLLYLFQVWPTILKIQFVFFHLFIFVF